MKAISALDQRVDQFHTLITSLTPGATPSTRATYATDPNQSLASSGGNFSRGA